MVMTQEQILEIASRIKPLNSAFIDGKFCAASDGKTFASINPVSLEEITHVAHASSADVDRAVQSARKAFDSGIWSRCEPEQRKQVLLKIADLISEHANELAVLESLDTGKTIRDCMMEIGEEAPKHFRWYAELIDKVFGKISTTGEDKLALIMYEPVGVAGLIVPWNFPFLMATWKIAPALAAGCSVLVKPAEDTPLSAIKLAELAQQAGLPDGVLHVLPGLGETTGQAIGRHKGIDAVSFTGSVEVGGKFLCYAGESNLKSVALELGGKSPFIVLDDAEINDDLIENAATAAFWNAGQNCTANMRQIVAKSLVEEYTQRIVARVQEYKVGNPLSLDTDIGTMINEGHMRRVRAYIEQGQKEGAKLLFAGQDYPDRGYFVAPAVFGGVEPNMVIAKEEIFGPVLGIMTAQNTEEALALAVDTDYGLQATVFSRDLNRALHMARRLPCGTVSINEFSEGNISTPFGGYKLSGSSLSRDNGTEAIQQYLQMKSIWIHQNLPF